MKAIVAMNGESGVELAERYIPSGILLDIQLPGMDGWRVLELLKALDDNAPHSRFTLSVQLPPTITGHSVDSRRHRSIQQAGQCDRDSTGH